VDACVLVEALGEDLLAYTSAEELAADLVGGHFILMTWYLIRLTTVLGNICHQGTTTVSLHSKHKVVVASCTSGV
jgi:K+ transporter